MRLMEKLFGRKFERRGDSYIVRYEDETGTHERSFATNHETTECHAQRIAEDRRHGSVR